MKPFIAFARSGAVVSTALAAHAGVNLRFLRRPPQGAGVPPLRISVLLPVRDEEARINPCLQALRVAVERYGPSAEVLVLDDNSTDDTAEIVAALLAGFSQARLLHGEPLPPGWLGKPYACHQLARAAASDSEVLVFLDADVVLEPEALRRAVAQLRESGLDLISPYPRQRAESVAERLVQPLLQWSWATLLPLRLAERSPRASLTAANGQFLLVDAKAYHASGGHAAAAHAVLDDIQLLKALKRNGFRGGVTDGTDLAVCRMYDGWGHLRDGYSKSLWEATGSPAGGLALCATLVAVYVLPPLAWLRRPRDGVLALGTVAAIANRAVVARRVGGRVWPDSAAHPLSIAAFSALTARSWIGRRRGTLRWKSRTL